MAKYRSCQHWPCLALGRLKEESNEFEASLEPQRDLSKEEGEKEGLGQETTDGGREEEGEKKRKRETEWMRGDSETPQDHSYKKNHLQALVKQLSLLKNKQAKPTE